MQFIANGPDVPNPLLQAHEDGQVVFFCGAGISYPAGLPGFGGLVAEIYKILGATKTKPEEDTFENGKYDVTLNLLEERITGGRTAVRRALQSTLQPKLRRKGAKETHSALLELAKTNENKMHLVTTNFDLIFEKLLRKSNTKRFQAPLLPVPHKSRWDGLVYLHGLLPEDDNEAALDQLVASSSDFGRAYLTERWASRFITELFRNYVVCFVGYSIDDPILRYMMDALAADRQLGQVTNQAFAFGSSTPETLVEKQNEWIAKGVTPILYETPTNTPGDHSKLHETLSHWSSTYRDGISGKLKIVSAAAHAKPLSSTLQDDYVGRLIWTLTDKTGAAAEHFADLIPPPSLDWLDPLLERRFGHDDLKLFSVEPQVKRDESLNYSFAFRPAPYKLAAPMALIPNSNCATSALDPPMFHLARWLLRHLDDPKLILKITSLGSFFHPKLKSLIQHQLDRIDLLKARNDHVSLKKLKDESPKCIPSDWLRVLWDLLLANQIKLASPENDLHEWVRRFKRKGIVTTGLRLELREILQPKIQLSEYYHDSTAIKTELALSAHHIPIEFCNSDNKIRKELIENCFNEFDQLLLDGLDLLHSCSDYSVFGDPSSWDMPSIEPHWQNRKSADWVILIELLRDGWLALFVKDKSASLKKAIQWFKSPHPAFKRLALFAASQPNSIENMVWIEWLAERDSPWLWGSATKREVLRLFVQKGAELNRNEKAKLEKAILAGPPRDMFNDELSRDWEDLVDRDVWLRLEKLKSSGLKISTKATTRLKRIKAAHPNWEIENNERDEFNHWMSGTGDPGWSDDVVVDTAPTDLIGLVAWLRPDTPEYSFYREDDWERLCQSNLYLCIYALFQLSQESVWPVKRWDRALHAFSDERILELSWNVASPIIRNMPTNVISDIDHSLSRWLEHVVKNVNVSSANVIPIAESLLNAQTNPNSLTDQDGEPIGEPTFEAINHPIGKVTTALISLWFSGTPADGQGLPDWLAYNLRLILGSSESRFRHGKTIVAQHLIALYRVDPTWTRSNLLPLFDWNVEDKVIPKSVWEGFLISARIYPPLMSEIKDYFVDTAAHYDHLKETAARYVSVLTVMGLESIQGYSTEDFVKSFSVLPQDALNESVKTIYESIKSAGDRREHYWTNRVEPFWKKIWPKSNDLLSQEISEFLIRTILEAEDQLQAATETLENWLIPSEYPFHIVDAILESGMCRRYPGDILKILNAIIDDQQWHSPTELKECLAQICSTQPELQSSAIFVSLNNYVQSRPS